MRAGARNRWDVRRGTLGIAVAGMLLVAKPVLADPWEAYDAQDYPQALNEFLDMQVENPNDPSVALAIGSTYYRLHDYARAQAAFERAAAHSDSAEVKEQALYNLGNTAFHSGRLKEAIERFEQAVALKPDDKDAAANLQYTKTELQRRKEQAHQQPGDDGQKQEGQQQQQGQQQEGQQQQGEQQQVQQQQGQQQQGGQQQQDTAGDSDHAEQKNADGKHAQGQQDQSGDPNTSQQHNLPGKNPDAAQDANQYVHAADKQNGGSDPNGTQAAGAFNQDGHAKGDGDKEAQALTPRQAEKLLDTLGEHRPKRRSTHKAGQRRAHDW